MRTAEEIAKMMTRYVECKYCLFRRDGKCSPFKGGFGKCYRIWLAWINGEIEVE